MRKLLVFLLVLAALAVGVDRLALSIASGVVASELRRAGALKSDPSVTVKGFPFLTQAFRGRFDQVDLSATSLSRGGIRLARFDATLVGVQVPLTEALSDVVRTVPVERITATALVAYADLAAAMTVDGARIRPVAGGLQVTARLVLGGRPVTVTTVSSVRLAKGVIILAARSVKAQGTPVALTGAPAAALDLRVPVGRLPYGLRLTGLTVTGEGLLLTATAGAAVLPTRP